MDKERQSYVCGAGAVLLWSTVASAFKISLRHSAVLPLLLSACLASTLFFFGLLVYQCKLSLLKTSSAGQILRSALLGFLNPFLYYIVLFKAYTLLPAQEALTLNFVWPITLVLLSVPLLGQKIRPKSIAAILISFFGVFVIATRGNILAFRFTNPAGVLLAVGSSVIWALFWIYNLKDNRDETTKLFLNFAFGSLFLCAAAILFSQSVILNRKAYAGAVYIGLFEMGVTFFLWMRALKLSRTTAFVANLIYLVPFLSIVCIHLVVGEPILLSTMVGLVLIVTGIVLQKL